MAVEVDWLSGPWNPKPQRGHTMKLIICAISLLAFASAGGQHIKGGSRIISREHPLLRGSGIGGLSKRGGGGGLHHAAGLDPITQQQAIADPVEVVQEQIISTNGIPRGISRTYRVGQSLVPYGLSGLDYYSYPSFLHNRRPSLSRKTIVSDNLSGLSPVGSRIKGGGLSSGRLRFGNQPQVIKTVVDPFSGAGAQQFTLGDAQIAADPFGSRRNQYRVGQSLIPYGLSGLDYYSYPSQLFLQRPVAKGGLGGIRRVQTIPAGSVSPGNVQFTLGDSQIAAIDPLSQILDQPQVTLTETVKGGSLGGLGGGLGGPLTTTTVTKSTGSGLGGTQVTRRAVTKGGGIGGAQFVLNGGQLGGFGGRKGGGVTKTTVTKSTGGLGGGLGGSGNIHFVLGDGSGLGGFGQGAGQKQVTTVTKTTGGGLGGGLGAGQVTKKTVTKSLGGGLGGSGIGSGNIQFVLGDGAGLGGAGQVTTVTKSTGSGLGGPRQVTQTVTKSGGGAGIKGAQFVLGGGQLGGISGLRSSPRQVTKTTVTQSGGGGLGGLGGQQQVTKTVTKSTGGGLGGLGGIGGQQVVTLGGLGGAGQGQVTKTVIKSAGDELGGIGLGGLGGQQVTKTVTKSAGGGLGGLGLGGLGGQVTRKTIAKSAGDGLGGIGLGGLGGQQVTKTVTKSTGGGLGGLGLGGLGGQQVTKTVTKSAGGGLGGLGLGGLGGQQVTKTVTKSAGDGLGGLGLGGLGGQQVSRKTVTKSAGSGLRGSGIGGSNIRFVLGDGSGIGGTGPSRVTTTTVTGPGLGSGQVTKTAVTKSSGGGIGGAQFVLNGGQLVRLSGRRPGQVTKTVTRSSGGGLGGFGLGSGLGGPVTTTVTKSTGGGLGGVQSLLDDPIGQEKITTVTTGGLGSSGIGAGDIQAVLGDGLGGTGGGFGSLDDGVQLALADSELGGGLGDINQQKLAVLGGSGLGSGGNVQFTLGDAQIRGGDGIGSFGDRLSQVQYVEQGRLGGLFPGIDVIGGSRIGDPRIGYFQRPRTSRISGGPSIQLALGDDEGFSTLDGQGHVDVGSIDPIVVAQAPVLTAPAPRVRARKITTLRKAGTLASSAPGNIQFTLGDSDLGGSGLGQSKVAYLDDGVIGGLAAADGVFGQRKVTTTTVTKAAPAPVVLTSSRVLDPTGSRRGGIQFTLGDTGVVGARAPFVRKVTVRRPQAIAQDRIESTLVQDGLGSGIALTSPARVIQEDIGGLSGGAEDIQVQLGDGQILSSSPFSGGAPAVQQIVDPSDSSQVQLSVDDVIGQSSFSQPAGVTRVKETTVSTAPGSSLFGGPSAVAVTKVTEVAQSPVGISSGGFSDGDLQQKVLSGDIGVDLSGYSPRVSFGSQYPYDVPSGSFLASADPIQQVLDEQQHLENSGLDVSGLYSPRVSFTSQYPYDVPEGVVLGSADPFGQVSQEQLEQIVV